MRRTLWTKISIVYTIEHQQNTNITRKNGYRDNSTTKKARTLERVDQSKHCPYHKKHGHHTKACVALKDRIEELVQAAQLRRFIRDGAIRNRQSPEPRGRGMLVEEKNNSKGGTTRRLKGGTKEENEGWRDETREVITILNRGEAVSEV